MNRSINDHSRQSTVQNQRLFQCLIDAESLTTSLAKPECKDTVMLARYFKGNIDGNKSQKTNLLDSSMNYT